MLSKQQFDDWAIGLKPRRGAPPRDASGIAAPAQSSYEFSPRRLVHIRHRTRLSQKQFARLLNVSVRTVQNWEQGRRRPTGPAVSLIRIVDRDAPLALRALRIPVPEFGQ